MEKKGKSALPGDVFQAAAPAPEPLTAPATVEPWVLWGSELSPFALKVEALLRFAGVPYRWLPAAGGFARALRFARRRQRLVARRLALTWPIPHELDEFPLVPFLFGPQGENLYDSSAIGAWLAERGPWRDSRAGDLLPREDAALRFAVRLADEAFDEVGLYLAHHHRWVVSARDNDAGARLAREMRPLLGPLARLVGRSFPARQVRRLPYLFSVASAGDATWSDLPARLRPPDRTGFPPTHELLERSFAELLAAIEPIFASRPFLFGERFTLADASLYGQLGMNRSDPSAWALIGLRAPATARFVERLSCGDFAGHRDGAPLALDERIAPLFAWIGRTFVDLMQQNAAAFARARAAGVQRFNERAFDAREALYDGRLLDQPFRSVVKAFQVRVWRDLQSDWSVLAPADRVRLARLLPDASGLAASAQADSGVPARAPALAPFARSSRPPTSG